MKKEDVIHKNVARKSIDALNANTDQKIDSNKVTGGRGAAKETIGRSSATSAG